MLCILRGAIKGCCKVKMTYHGRTKGDVTARTVRPYGFIYGHRHYIVACSEKAKTLRAFSLPHIAEVTLLEEAYRKDPTFNL